MFFKESVKFFAAVSVNTFLLFTAIQSNHKYNAVLSKMSPKKREELRIRDFALKNNPFYHSDNPILRAGEEPLRHIIKIMSYKEELLFFID